MTKQDGGPAFPVPPDLVEGSPVNCYGMSLRDYFAAKAMQAVINDGNLSVLQAVKLAYQAADEMLAERSK